MSRSEREADRTTEPEEVPEETPILFARRPYKTILDLRLPKEKGGPKAAGRESRRGAEEPRLCSETKELAEVVRSEEDSDPKRHPPAEGDCSTAQKPLWGKAKDSLLLE